MTKPPCLSNSISLEPERGSSVRVLRYDNKHYQNSYAGKLSDLGDSAI